MTDTPRRGRPPSPAGRKPVLTVRITQSVSDQAAAIAAARDETLGRVIEAALRRYIARHRDELPIADGQRKG